MRSCICRDWKSGDKICLKWEIEDLSLHVINSRKLNAKALVSFEAAVDELMQVQIPIEIQRGGPMYPEK